MKVGRPKRFFEIAGSAKLHGSVLECCAAVSSRQNDGTLPAGRVELLQKIQPTDPGHLYVGDETDGTGDVVRLEKIKELRPFNQVDFSGTMETFLTRGEVIVGILDSAAVTRLSLKGEKLSWVAPKEGVFMFEQVFNVLKGSKKKELAYQWINWQLSPETQLKWANGFFWSRVNVKTELSDDLKALIPIHGDEMGKIILWDWKTANANRDKVIERWNKEMR